MDQSPEIRKAATAAASFSLMLLQAYYSGQQKGVSTDLKAGLMENATNGKAWDLILEFSDGEQLTATPAEMAERNPDACIQLGEIFACALLTGAEDAGHYMRSAVSQEWRSSDISMTLQTLSAPTLARMLRPG